MNLHEITDRAVARCGNGFAAINVAAKRARQLTNGVPPLVYTRAQAVTTALKEIAQGKVAVR